MLMRMDVSSASSQNRRLACFEKQTFIMTLNIILLVLSCLYWETQASRLYPSKQASACF